MKDDRKSLAVNYCRYNGYRTSRAFVEVSRARCSALCQPYDRALEMILQKVASIVTLNLTLAGVVHMKERRDMKDEDHDEAHSPFDLSLSDY